MADSGLRREEIFITTKVWTSNWGYEKARASIRRGALRGCEQPPLPELRLCVVRVDGIGRLAAGRCRPQPSAGVGPPPTPLLGAILLCSGHCRQSLNELGTPYVDLFLLHAPGNPATRADTWRALEDGMKEVRFYLCLTV